MGHASNALAFSGAAQAASAATPCSTASSSSFRRNLREEYLSVVHKISRRSLSGLLSGHHRNVEPLTGLVYGSHAATGAVCVGPVRVAVHWLLDVHLPDTLVFASNIERLISGRERQLRGSAESKRMSSFWRRVAVPGKTDLPCPLAETQLRIAACNPRRVVASGTTDQRANDEKVSQLHLCIVSGFDPMCKSVELSLSPRGITISQLQARRNHLPTSLPTFMMPRT